jgi:hypothetical protein
MLVYYLMDDGGSAQDVRNFSRVARELGHEIVVYGPDEAKGPICCSKDLASADRVIFIFEWTTDLRYGDGLDLARIVGQVPRSKRIVVDCDGAYNEAIQCEGDYNHKESTAALRWMSVCESLSDRIFQPTLRPRRPNVGTFLFHGYNPAWERPLNGSKDYGMVYVGHSKFRWRPMRHVLGAVEEIRSRVGPIALIGHGWDAMPSWAAPMNIEDYYYTEPAYLERMGVQFVPPISSHEVIPWMSRAVFNPVIYRPLFSHLGLVTCRTFETPGAGTIPVFGLDPQYVCDIYGRSALELVLPEHEPESKLADIFERPGYYAEVVTSVRENLRRNHSYEARFKQLLAILEANQ